VSWKRLRGHDALVESFDRVVKRGRLAHAYLFTGPAGVGKRLFAGELAKALLCEAAARDKLDACDACAACRQVVAGTHPDFYTASRPDDKVEFPIEVVRELCKGLGLKPARGRYKIAILDDAEDLNEESSNSFLKTLEEPPPRSVLILISNQSERQLSTIISRCQVVPFAPLPAALVAELLRAQGMEDEGLLERVVRLSGGSPGEAQALADPALWEFRRALLHGLTRSHPNTVTLAQQWTQFVEEAGKEGPVRRRRATQVLGLLMQFLRESLRLSVGGTPELVDAEDLGLLKDMGQRANSNQIVELLELCLEAEFQIDHMAQIVLVLEALVDAFGQTLGPPSRAAG
jgi:DNA polymerase-3 subunit delta'